MRGLWVLLAMRVVLDPDPAGVGLLANHRAVFTGHVTSTCNECYNLHYSITFNHS